jgi:hypothetical protein
LLVSELLVEEVYPGHELEFIPIWFADIWRVALFAATSITIGSLVTMTFARYGTFRWATPSMMWFHFALIFTMLLNVTLQIERFNQPVLVEGLVSGTIITALVGVAVWEYRKETARLS